MLQQSRASQGLFFIFACTAMLMVGCESHRVHYDENMHVSTSTDSKGVDLSVEWLKNKADGIDVMAWINNQSSEDVFTGDDSFRLIYDGQAYNVRRAETTSEVALVPAGERRKVLLLFALERDNKRRGTATLELRPLYEGKIGGNNNRTLPELKLDLALENSTAKKM